MLHLYSFSKYCSLLIESESTAISVMTGRPTLSSILLVLTDSGTRTHTLLKKINFAHFLNLCTKSPSITNFFLTFFKSVRSWKILIFAKMAKLSERRDPSSNIFSKNGKIPTLLIHYFDNSFYEPAIEMVTCLLISFYVELFRCVHCQEF